MDMKANGKQKLSFMGKLVRMLAESDPAVVRWSDSGNSFLVLDCKRCAIVTIVLRFSPQVLAHPVVPPPVARRFTGEVLKNYLRTTNFASFVRQLNYYGTVRTAGIVVALGRILGLCPVCGAMGTLH